MENELLEEREAAETAKPATVLVVDGEPDLELLVTQKFRRQIRNGEYVFIFARSGSEALDRLKEQETDVVLTDIQLPDMDGLALIARLKTEYPLLRSVLISAYGDMRTIRRALNLGAFDFLTKPIDIDDLGITITKTVEEALAIKEAVRDRESLTAISQELDVAQRIQLSMIPRKFPAFPGRHDFEVYGLIKTARQVGGDFYDFGLIEDDCLYFAIGDASGKGVPAALYMAVTRTMMKADAMKRLPPERCLAESNKILCMENEFNMFITAFIAVMHTKTGEITYSNGGHKLPIIIRADGSAEFIENTDGIALGVIDREGLFHHNSVRLDHGDSIFLYSDGVTEAMNGEGQLYTDGRLNELLGSTGFAHPRDSINTVLKDVEAYKAGASQKDDMVMLSIRYN